jgi:FtsP/CotA-like multicopper oxidase with cupredoxin domain
MDRRSLLKLAGFTPFAATLPRWARGAAGGPSEKADYTLRIGTGLVELAPDHIVSTTLYNGEFPGPLVRLQEGHPVVVDIYNDTDTPELVHWHGQMIPSDVDGASEEGSPFVPAHGTRRITFTPKPSGFRFYHTHVVARDDLDRGTYTGQAGPVYIEPAHNPGGYDREVFLILKEFQPAFSRGGDMEMDMLVGTPVRELQQIEQKADEEAKGMPKGFEVGTAERISAIVEMNHPGVWVMGDLADDDRRRGMGIVVEYAGRSGKPQWAKAKPFRWDYTRFGKTGATAAAPDETIEITVVKYNAADHGFNLWTLNGEAFSMKTMKPMYAVHEGRRYRLKFRNGSDDIHPLHLHRHSFELTRIGGKPTSGVIKDVVMLGGFQEVEFDFVADNPGLTLFHCHQQLHMDFGFMALFQYA